MGNQVSPEAHGPDGPELPVPESPNTKLVDGAKKKKKSRKSKNKDRSSPPAPSNHVELAQSRDEDQSRPSKRKHESDPEHKKKKKKKHHEAKRETNDVSMNVAKVEPEQITSPQPETSPEASRTVQNGVEKATPAKSAEATKSPVPNSVSDVDNLSTVELNNREKPKKLRGSRPGGKDNLKVGFFTPDEVEKVEHFKISWSNMHGIGHTTFNEMIQHSEREGAEWPGPPDAPSKHELWTDIYAVLPDRDRRSLYRFARRHFQIPGQKAHEWTKEQDEELVELMKQHPAKYALIGKMLGRSDDDVTQRWKNRLQHREKMNRGNWNLDETLGFMKSLQDFFEAHKEISPATAGNDIYEMDQKVIPWGSVSDSISNSRSRQQCADKWRKVCSKVKAERAKGNKDYVFDPQATVEKTSRWKERSCGANSEERVIEDEEDDNDESPVATSTPASKLKYGFVDHQIMTGMMPKAENDTPIKTTSSPLPDVDMEDEEEKIKAANKLKSSKKRRHSEVEAEPQPEPELVFPEVSSPSKEQAEDEERRERKQRKKERKEKKRQRALEKQEAEQARNEVEAAVTAAKESSFGKKTKKHKKHRKHHDANALVAAIAAPTSDKKQKKHRKSDAGAIAIAESPETLKKHKDKKKKKKATHVDGVTIKQEHSI
ncbi:hypothetical protein N7526_003682 [Penicillium atrosanguineum]|nr:hypothetical protein N7526_003682 [Penicillium atrosanguineum]